ncbi:MAG: hypothetical protein PSY12_01690 [bacterium]|nr:hypothetical protein [bacterium]
MRGSLLLPLVLLAACGSKSDDQPGAVTNILDQAVPNAQSLPPPANAIVPVEPRPPVAPKATTMPSDAIPTAIQGNWTGTADRCGDRASALELTITATQLVFHESVGLAKTVTARADGGLSIVADFTGEGQSWTRTLVLTPSADGQQLTIANDGASVTRKRCS